MATLGASLGKPAGCGAVEALEGALEDTAAEASCGSLIGPGAWDAVPTPCGVWAVA